MSEDVRQDLRDAQRGIANLEAYETEEKIEALAMALAFLIRAVRTQFEQDEARAAMAASDAEGGQR